MQTWALFHPDMLHQTSLRKEIGGQLNGASETSAHHSGSNTTVQSINNTLRLVDLPQPIKRISVLVLCADREERRIGLEASFD